MENASKALIMAGGILIAILVIGALLLMFNNIGDYEKNKSSEKKSSQLAKFNEDFERYVNEDTIYGTDLISLANKIIDYNKKVENGGSSNYIDYTTEMQLFIDKLEDFSSKYGKETFGVAKDWTITNDMSQYDVKNNSSFKIATFKKSKEPKYENGQIKILYFEFYKK